MSDVDKQHVLNSLNNSRNKNVVAGFASQVLHLLTELKRQLQDQLTGDEEDEEDEDEEDGE